MNEKTIYTLLSELAGRVCDDLCKWPEQCGEDDEKLYAEHCNSCPLNILGI